MRAAAAALLAAVVCVAPAGAADPADPNAALVRYLGKRANYKKVRRDVISWHGTMTNGCVAFISTAMRHLGIDVPQTGKIDGDGVSRITRAFSIFLEDQLGWTRFTDPAELRPGDLVFTTDVECCPGYPAHVFVFHSWADERARVAWAIDNQGHTHRRPLYPDDGDGDIDPFAYALRAAL